VPPDIGMLACVALRSRAIFLVRARRRRSPAGLAAQPRLLGVNWRAAQKSPERVACEE